MKFRIGELLIKYGIVTKKQLEEALVIQRNQDKRLGEILIELEYLKPKDLIWILSEQADIPFVQLKPEMLDQELVNRFPEKLLYRNCILPLYETEDSIYIAQGDPTSAAVTQDIEEYTQKNIVVSGADPVTITHLLNKFFLSQQAENIVDISEKKVAMRIISKDAYVESIDEAGNKFKKRGSIEIIIRSGENNEEDKNGNG